MPRSHTSLGRIRPADWLDSSLLRAKCREALNDVRGAEEDLGAAVETFERKRSTLTTAQDRMQAFEQERAAFKDLVRLEIATRGDEGAALRISERARAGVLLENWSGPSRVPVDPAVAYRDIPPDIAIVYYETLPDRVLGWVLTRERCVHFTRPVSLAALGNMVARIQRLIRDGADVDSLKPHSAPLFDALGRVCRRSSLKGQAHRLLCARWSVVSRSVWRLARMRSAVR